MDAQSLSSSGRAEVSFSSFDANLLDIEVTQQERKSKRARKRANLYDGLDFPGDVDDPSAEVEYYRCDSLELRRGAAGSGYDGTRYASHLIFPPFSLRMNAYEKLCRKFLHVYNHHDMPPLRDIIRSYCMSDVVTYFLHQASLINPSGWPNYIRVHGVDDFVKFIGATFVLHPDSVFFVEEAFNKAEFARHHGGKKVVVCRTNYRSTLTITFPVRKSFQTLVTSMNIPFDELTKEHMVLLQGLESVKFALKNVKSCYSYTTNPAAALTGKSSVESSSSESSGGNNAKAKKRKLKKKPQQEEPVANQDPPVPPTTSNPTLAEELKNLLDMAREAIRLQTSAASEESKLHDGLAKLSLNDQFVNYTITIPIRKQLIVFFEFDPYDKVTGIRFTYKHVPVA
eukprot:gene24643-29776_t